MKYKTRRTFLAGTASAAMLQTLFKTNASHGAEAIGAATASHQTLDWIKPKGLKRGDTIALVATSGPADRTLVLAYQKQMEAIGFVVKFDERMLDRKKEYLAGSDDQRVEELNQAIRDPQVRGILPVRGGFGLTRILDRVDYEALRRDPKVITGYSDITALHLANARMSRVISFHSPMPMSNLARSDLPEYAFANQSFERMLLVDKFPKTMIGEAIGVPKGHQVKTLQGGRSQGRLIGGNLTLVVSTLGTRYAMEPAGAILFLEDVHEEAYRVDRMLSQLRLAGILDSVAGIVMGRFTYKEPSDELKIGLVIEEYMKQVRCPVIANFPVGHVPENATLPFGAQVEVDADQGKLIVMEEPCER
jgi:muramoyltetrapeptide carboxypeptidase